MARALADFDKMVSEMKASGVTGEPIRMARRWWFRLPA